MMYYRRLYLNSLFSFKKNNISEFLFENFNLSENNIITVELAQVYWGTQMRSLLILLLAIGINY
jgi:hypothetical protein